VRHATRQPTPATRRAFTLVELLVSIGVITLLLTILIVALGGARNTAQRVAAQQTVTSLGTAVRAFKNDFGFAPPLVKDNNSDKYGPARVPSVTAPPSPVFNGPPINLPGNVTPQTFRFSTAADNAADRDYLRLSAVTDPRDWQTTADYRFSEYSLAYYLVGALPATVDGVDGPGFTGVTRDGAFTRSGVRYAPYFDTAGQPDSIGLYVSDGITLAQSEREGRYELRDRNGVAIRYYRWLSGDPAGGAARQVRTPNDLRVPFTVAGRSFGIDGSQVRYDDPSLREAEWAIVAAGPSGTFGDLGTEGAQRIVDATGVRIDSSDQDGVVARAVPVAQRDNIVEVGR